MVRLLRRPIIWMVVVAFLSVGSAIGYLYEKQMEAQAMKPEIIKPKEPKPKDAISVGESKKVMDLVVNVVDYKITDGVIRVQVKMKRVKEERGFPFNPYENTRLMVNGKPLKPDDVKILKADGWTWRGFRGKSSAAFDLIFKTSLSSDNYYFQFDFLGRNKIKYALPVKK